MTQAILKNYLSSPLLVLILVLTKVSGQGLCTLDTIAPTVYTQNISINLDQDGLYTLLPSEVDNGSTDNCALDIATVTPNQFDCDDIGANTVILTWTDESGNFSSAAATVTVSDVMPPQLDLLPTGDTLRLNQFGLRLVTVPGIIGQVSDNCTDVSDIIINISSTNSCNNVTKSGTSITLDCSDESRVCGTPSNPYDLRGFTITATDNEGNVTTITRDYFVYDLFAPEVYPENITLYLPEDPAENAQLVVNADLNTGSEAGTALDPVGLDSATNDACGLVSVELLRSPIQWNADLTHTYTCEDLGTNTYWLRATDIYDHRASYLGTVTIVDTIKPDVNTTIADIYIDNNGIATLNPIDLVLSASDNIGDCGLNYSASQIDYSCADLSWNTTIVNPSQADARNTANWTPTQVTSLVTDAAGNVRAKTASARVMDTLPPVLLKDTIEVDLGLNNFVSLQSVQDTILAHVSTDNCELDLNRGGLARTYFDCDDVGPNGNSVALTMFDVYGNSQQVQLVIIVNDITAPTLSAVTSSVAVSLDVYGSASITESDVVNTYSDNCGGSVTVSMNPTSFDCSDLGPNNITLTAIDESGNSTAVTKTVNIVDNEAPELTVSATSVVLYLDSNGLATINASGLGASATDNCTASPNITLSNTSFSCADVGSNTITITATDASGNSVLTTKSITVYDTLPPVTTTDTMTSYGPYTWIDGNTYIASNNTATHTLTNAAGCDSIVTLHLTIPGTWTQVGTDIDGEAAGDYSGYSVSLSSDGRTMAIGAWRNDGNGTDAGHVRIYKNTNGTWSQVGADIDGEAAVDYSGYSVSLSSDGSTVAIGAHWNDGNGTYAGHVRIYKNISGTWTQVGADIDGEAAGDLSGRSISLSSDGSTVAIGAYFNVGNGGGSGHVRIYKNTNGTWTQVGTDIDGEAAGDYSGGSVSLSSDGSTVAIGAEGNDGNGTDAGHVRIYKNISGTWTQVGTDIDGEAADDRSGESVSISSDGSTVAIGAWDNTNAGHVRIYKNTSGTWTQVGADIDGEATGDRSGRSISLSSDGSTVAIGAYLNDGNGTYAGHVRIYKNISGTWSQVGADIDGEAANDGSGSSVSLSSDGSTVAIGAPFNDGNGADAGHVRVFNICLPTFSSDTITSCGPYTWIDGVTYTTSNYTATDTLVSATGCDSIVTLHLTIPNALTGNWTQVGADIDGEAAGDNSGNSVSLSSDGSTLAIGAWRSDGNGTDAGHVRIYKNINGSWTQVGADIDGEAAGDRSGYSVSLSSDGNTVAIGAMYNNGNGTWAGHVRIYKNTSGSWTQVGADIDGEAAGDQSGFSISLSSDGSTIAIGARDNDGNGTSAGHVRIYKNTNGTWTQVGADIDGEAAFDDSGYSVSLSSDGSTVAIGAVGNDGNGSHAGHVRIYKNINGTWTQVGADIDGEAAFDRSGYSVSLSSDGSTVAIGAVYNNGNGTYAGHVRIYKNTNGTWTQVGADIDGEAAYDESGGSVSLSSDGNTVAIGAMYNNGTGTWAGHVRIYKNINGSWTQVGTDIDGEAVGDYSGYSVSLSSDGSTLAIGAFDNDGNGSNAGHVRVYKIESVTYSTDTITSCGPYTWIDGVTYTTSNYSATDTLVSATGCDSIVTLHLTINSSNTGTDVITACDSYTWIDGNTYTANNNIATYTLSNVAGCDSVVTLDLTINSSNTGADVITACDSYTWIDGNTYTANNNTATYTLTNAAGCDSVVTLDLTINSSNTGTDVITACDSYTWIDGNTYTASNNTATYTLTNAAGCDSVVTLNLTINSSNTGTDMITACDSYTWIDGNTYTSSNNTATHTLTNAAGCDSVVTLDLTINSSNTGADVITACDSYTWIDGLTYTANNNTATYTLTNAAGCDSVVTLNLTINSSNTGTDVITACDSYTWIDGNTYTASNNTATYTLTNAAGCDSVVTLDLTINSSNTGADVITACDSYTWIDGNTYTASNNIATYTLTNVAGCDSVVTLDLTINSSNTGTDVITACDSYTWIDGNTYTASNNAASYTLTNAVGCDSVVTLDLTINSSNTGTDVITACDSYTWIDGNMYTASNNTATYTLTNVSGCDSVVTLNLTINSSNTGTDVITACDSYTWIDGNTYTASNNTATYTLTNAAGCDSVVTLDLTINSSNTGTDVITACDSYTWIDGNTYTASNNSATYVLNNVNGCDSVVTLDLTITYSNTGQVSLNGCDQVSLNGQTYTVSGTYVQNLVNSDGCDSILTINANITYSNFIQSQPTNQSVGEGLNAVFFIVGPPTAQYQWQTNLGIGYQDLNDFGQYSGTTTSSLQVSNVNLAINNNQAFRCLVTEGNCTDTSGTVVLEVVPSSSVNEFEQGINIYPNPTQGIVEVVLSEASGIIRIYDLQGRLLDKILVNQKEMQVSLGLYANGVYVIQIEQNGLSSHHKITLNR